MERVPVPRRENALAPCRIGFQPVSPNHGTNHRESDLSPKYCRQFIDQRRRPCPGKASSCGPGDRLEAYPSVLSGAPSDDPRLSWSLLPTLSTLDCREMPKLQDKASRLTASAPSPRRRGRRRATQDDGLKIRPVSLRPSPKIDCQDR